MHEDRGVASRRGVVYTAIAVLLFSTSPIFIRWAAPLSSFEIVFGRLAIAAVALAVVMLARREKWGVSRAGWGLFLVFGLITALHFLLYIASLSFTTIAHSLSLVYTAPIFVALFSMLFLKERMTRKQWVGIAIAVGGIAILAGFQPQFTSRMLFGDLLALGSAITFGLYSVAGRSQRTRYSLLTYAMTVYAAAALWSLIPAGIAYTPGAYTPRAILSVIALGLLPLALGHTLYNAALRRMNATYVNVIATQEVTGGVLLGAILLSEMPTWNEIAGAAVTLLGVLIVIL